MRDGGEGRRRAAIVARRAAARLVETQPASPMITFWQQVGQEEALAEAGIGGGADLARVPKVAREAPISWSIGVPSCVPEVK